MTPSKSVSASFSSVTSGSTQNQPGEFHGRVAVITGGESGIGRATAKAFARLGAHVFVGDIAQHDENRSEFTHLGIRSLKCDVLNLGDLRNLIDTAVKETGRLDFLVNNAGIGMTKQIGDVSESDWDRCLGTNLKAAFFGCQFAIPHFLRNGGGCIVNTASNAGILPRAHDPVYSISKQALVGLTKSLGLCHSKDRIRINAVCPGPVGDTGMMNADLAKSPDVEQTKKKFIESSPLARAWGRMITPDEVADAIVYLCRDASCMVT
ncbi:MAG: SDR family oxidoreductase, partial [Planctomycetes bacterium]|nr:SDR family oxidoreductase [Planctomycetota bacterium]